MLFNTKLKSLSLSVNEITLKTRQWFENNPEIEKTIDQRVTGFDDLILAVPSLMDEDYGFLPPWVYLYHEANQELDSTLNLALSGMYKESLRTLRSFIELNLLGIYYFTTKDVTDFKKWLNGEKETPLFKYLSSQILEKNARINKLQELEWEKSIRTLYKALSQFVHTGGHNGSFQVLRSSNNIQFNEKGIQYVMQELSVALKLTSAALVACFPLSLKSLPLFDKFGFGGPASGFFEQDQVDRTLRIFKDEKDYQDLLQRISAEDEDANSLAEGILSLPDLTEKEEAETFNNFLNGWLQDEKGKDNFLKEVKDKDFGVVVAMVRAHQRAFMKVSLPLLNEHFLGLDNLNPETNMRSSQEL